MDKAILKTTFRGISKADVLMSIDSLEAMFLAVQSGAMDKTAALSEAAHIANAPFKKQLGGFAEEDVRAYLKKLYDAIAQFEPEGR